MDGPADVLSPVALNPAGTGDFGRRHVILNGRTSKPMQHGVVHGPFSIKSVIDRPGHLGNRMRADMR